jgi:LmbE family N-acetylglucosaminyl deacetylase
VKVLVVCAHADDEVIAVGGAIRKLANAGAAIRLLMFSDGAEGYTTLAEKDTIVARRESETQAVCRILGIGEYFNLHQLDWNLKVDNVSYKSVLRHIREFKPDIIFAHSRSDYNDHRAAHDVAVEAWFHAGVPCAMAEGEVWPMAPLFEFEVLQPMPSPSVVVDITDPYAAKVQAMQCYASQHDLVGGVFQMMEGRALERGSLVGVKYGEALTRNYYRPAAVREVERLLMF